MSEPFLGEIRLFGFRYPPQGWALCNGQLMPISQNQALFSILGTTYGGNGTTTFALPDLRGRIPVQVGNGIQLGEASGEESHTLTMPELPAHTHFVSATNAEATEGSPAGNTWGASGDNPYKAASPDTVMNSVSIGAAGNGQPHGNMQPYLTLNFGIALSGIYPSRN